MTTLKRERRDPDVEDEFLPLAVRTLTVNGKRMTTAFYKQISEADLIDETTAELRGAPLGHFHLHTKECADVPHRHVLWGLETQLHLATIVARKDDIRYQRQAELSTQKQRTFIDLLALTLALAGHSPTIESVAEDRRKIQISGYTLYSSSAVADQIEGLEKARTQQKEDTRIWQEHQLSDETLEQGQAEALALSEQLASAGVEVAHPLRFQVDYDNYLIINRWYRYPAEANREDALLYWQVKDHWQRKQQESPFRKRVEAILPSPRKAEHLRLILAERILREHIERTRKMAEQFIQTESKPATVEELDPDQIFRSYEEENKRFKEYTSRWDEHLREIHAVGQLFLV
jgi:hypothetical protein